MIETQTHTTTVLACMEGKNKPPWHAKTMIRRKHVITPRESSHYSILFTEANRLADSRASKLPTSANVEVIPSSFAENMKTVVYGDKSGKLYLRM